MDTLQTKLRTNSSLYTNTRPITHLRLHKSNLNTRSYKSKHINELLAMAALNPLHVALAVIFSLTISPIANAADPDITSDFIVPPNSTYVDGNFFTFTGLRPLIRSPVPETFTVSKVSMGEFPALNGQSVSYAVLMFPPGSVNPPHTHPRASELLFVVYGSLKVGFVDTANKLYTQTLQAGDIFVFPKGLVHFQFCKENGPAAAISAFGSASAGTVSVPGAVFGSGIEDDALAKSFKTDVDTVRKIQASLATKD